MTAKRRKLIDLDSYTSIRGDWKKFQKELQSRLIDEGIFNFFKMEDLIFSSLKYVKPVNKNLRHKSDAINLAIGKILRHFDFKDREASISTLNEDGEFIPKIKGEKESDYDIYKKHILGFDKLPSQQLSYLKEHVEDDLKSINALVIKYENHPEIIKYKNDGKPLRNHETRTLIAFYQRALKERQKILNYFLDGIYERAIIKSKPNFLKNNILGWFEKMYDFPYDYGKRHSFINFDFEKINEAAHRLDNFSIAFTDKYANLYKRNKTAFYQKLFRENSKKQYWQNIEYYLNFLPISNSRKNIFQELKSLFNSRKWLAFYALALPQVEGLFSEMVSSAKPESQTLKKALPDKVDFIRPEYDLGGVYLDYYQYYLPIQRNRFMHTGLTTEYRLNAFDLLLDLEHVIRIFSELENPLVKITRILKRKNPDDFIEYKGYSDYFDLLKKMPLSQKKKLEKEIENFQIDFLLTDCQFEFIFSEALASYETMRRNLISILDYHFNFEKLKADFEEMNKPQLDRFFEDKLNFEKLRYFISTHKTELEELYLIRDFFQGVIKHFAENLIDEENKAQLIIWKESRNFIKKIELLEKKIINSNKGIEQ